MVDEKGNGVRLRSAGKRIRGIIKDPIPLEVVFVKHDGPACFLAVPCKSDGQRNGAV